MGLPAEQLYTVAKYLALEVRTGIKHEYHQGRVTAMAGGSPHHSRMSNRIGACLETRLSGKPCKPFNSDLKIKASGRILYPDVSVVCPPLRRDEEIPDAVTNPRVVIEVLSDSTASYDRTVKFELYRHNSEMTDYLLVDPMRPYAEHYTRVDEHRWNLEFLGPEGILRLPSIECEVPMGDLYEGMEILGEE
jgi:Uma2 family endonuclease